MRHQASQARLLREHDFGVRGPDSVPCASVSDPGLGPTAGSM